MSIHHLFSKALIATLAVFCIGTAQAIEIDSSQYDVYYGDFNSDGKNGDVYAHGKDKFILLHGDIAIPIVIDGPEGFVYYEDGDGTAYSLDLDDSQLALYTKAVLDQDYFWQDLNDDGYIDLVVYPSGGNGSTLVALGSDSASLPVASISADLGPENILSPGSENAVLASASMMTPGEIAEMDSVLKSTGTFDVGADGGSTYSLPIIASSGTAGVAPTISVTYSSNAGNGLLGQGGRLNGLSSINRCRSTRQIDGMFNPIRWNSDDKFCLNGQRLLVQSGVYGAPGSTYKTEIDSFILVTAVGGSTGHPDYFEQKAKDGSITRYGSYGAHNSEQSTAVSGEAHGDYIISWNISRFEDSVGNPIVYEYEGDSDNHRLRHIYYAYGASSSYNAHIQIDYEQREDVQRSFVAGKEMTDNQRVTEIRSYNNGQLLRSYVFDYFTDDYSNGAVFSHLNSITECVSAVCTSPTKFEWNHTPIADYQTKSDGATLNMTSSNSFVFDYKVLDINADSILDFVWVEADNNGQWQKVRYALGSNSSNIYPRDLKSYSVDLSDPDSVFDLEVLDYNADGRYEIAVRFGEYGTLPKWDAFLAVPGDQSFWGLSYRSDIVFPFTGNAVFTDFDGNGLLDAVVENRSVYELVRTGNPNTSTYYSFVFSQTLPFQQGGELGVETSDGEPGWYVNDSARAGDFNGDGKIDFIFHRYGTYGVDIHDVYDGTDDPVLMDQLANTGYGESFITAISHIELNVFTSDGENFNLFDTLFSEHESDKFNDVKAVFDNMRVVDVNGDGNSDIIYNPTLGVSNTWRLRLSDGTQFLPAQSIPYFNKSANFLDINRDGFVDMVKYDSTSQNMLFSSWDNASNSFVGDHVFAEDIGAFAQGTVYQPADVTGDTWTDLIVYRPGSQIINVYESKAEGSTPQNVVTRIDHGYSTTQPYTQTHIEYGTLARSNHYVRMDVAGIEYPVGIDETCPILYGADYDDIVAECSVGTAFRFYEPEFYAHINNPLNDYGSNHSLDALHHNGGPILEATGAYLITTRVKTSAPYHDDANNENAVSYVYHQARMQAGGRGWLGFKRVEKINEQTGISMATEFRQDWPFIGTPIVSETQTASDILLSSSRITPAILGFDTLPAMVGGTKELGAIQVYTSESIKTTYQLEDNGVTQGAAVSTSIDTSLPDAWGNVVNTVTTAKEGDESGVTFSTVTTSNAYIATEEGRFLGRLLQSDVTTERPGLVHTSNSVTKSATFSYYGMSGSSDCFGAGAALDGLLCEETIMNTEAGNITTTHYYDDFGNKTFTYAMDGLGTTRLSGFTEYDAQGRYPQKVYDVFAADAVGLSATPSSKYQEKAGTHAVRLISEVQARNRYGSVTHSAAYTGNSTLSAITAYTPFGIKYFSADTSGAYELNSSTYDTTDCPAIADYATRVRTAGGAEQRACFTLTGRQLRQASLAFTGNSADTHWNYVDTRYDKLGRAYQVSEPYQSGDSIYWNTTSFDLLNRPVTVDHAFFETDAQGHKLSNYAQSQWEYNGLVNKTINPDGQEKIQTSNIAGEVVAVQNNDSHTATYIYDVYGKLIHLTHPDGAITSMSYNTLGQKTSMDDPDKGVWSYGYNGFGELLCQTDALGQNTFNTYDVKGRQIERRRYTGGSCQAPTGLESQAYFEYDTGIYGLGKMASESADDGFARDYYFDAWGRASSVQTTIPAGDGIDASTHSSLITYDEFGRVSQNYDAARDGASFNRGAVQNIYDQHGFLWKVANAHRVNGDFAETYYEVSATDARGNVTDAKLGDKVSLANEYNPRSGLVNQIKADNSAIAGLPTNILDLSMRWDDVGNLSYRGDKGLKQGGGYRNLDENFSYDTLNRLTGYHVSGDHSHSTTISYTADGLENIADKSDVGAYLYGTGCGGIHAVCSAGGVSYSYNANGDMTGGDGRSVQYYVSGKVKQASKSGHTTDFYYDSSDSRYKRVDHGSQRSTTLYLGSVEKIYREDNTRQWKRTIAGVAQITMDFVGDIYQGDTTHYLLKDHLGSITALTDEQGALIQTMAFDPWGARRNTTTWQDIEQSVLSNSFDIANKPITTRGFTGHEMVDEVDMIHMNGRTYDAKLARFMQADPFIQEPTTIGSLNRYSYTLNNPLNATDPSGYFFSVFKKIRRSAIRASVKIFGPEITNSIGSLVSYWAGGPLGSAAWTYEFNRAQGATSSQAFKAGVKAGVTAYVSAQTFGRIGKAFEATPGSVGHVLAHGIAGGVLAELQGGEFKDGFISAGLTKGLTPKFAGIGDSRFLVNDINVLEVAIAAALGGTISEATGGKFANGAITAAFANAFNEQAGGARNRAQKDDPWNAKNVKGTRSVKISKGSPYEDVVSEGEWTHAKFGDLDLTDLIPQKRAAWALKLLSSTTDEVRVIEYGEFKNYDVYEYDVIYDLNNGNVENLMFEYGSRRTLDPIKVPTGRGQRFEVESRTCWFGSVGC